MKQILPFALSLLAAAAHAHEGHGLPGSHWHATDTAGFVVVAAVAAAVVWFIRRK